MNEQQIATDIRHSLREKIAHILLCKPEEVTDEVAFRDLGMDSVLGVELISLVNGAYGLDEQVETVYNHPTLAQFADYITERVQEKERGEAG